MSKKLLCLIFAIVLLMLTGCGGKTSDYREPESRLYISALGFDRQGDKIKVCAEAISVADNTSGGYSIKHYEGEGDSIDSAMYEITKNLAPSVNLSHCALLVLGEEIEGEYLDKVISYSFEEREISHSVQLIATEDAKNLLQYNKEATIPLGFAIGELLAEDTDGIGADKFSTLVSVINSREKDNDLFYLPYFEVEDKTYLFSGTRLYKGSLAVGVLSRAETQLIKIARNEFRGGEIKLDFQREDIVAELDRVYTTAKWEDSDTPKLLLSVDVKSQSAEKTV